MATMLEIDPQDGDVIEGTTGKAPVCLVRGELFWNGQFVSAYGGDAFLLVSRSNNAPTAADIAQRELDKLAAIKADALDRKYS